MALVFMHTGQSGVERGVDRAARTLGFDIGGTCTPTRRDEFGKLPPEILADLEPCPRSGSRSALSATLAQSDVLVIAIPDASHVGDETGIAALRRLARASGVPHWVVDPQTNLDQLATRLRRMELASGLLRVMVTGPRLTRWTEGERIASRIVAQIDATRVSVTSNHRILVADDCRETAEATSDLLRDLGHDVIVATSGREAIEVATKQAPDIVLLDIQLGDLDGYEVAHQLRQTQTKPLFLAAITGWDQARDPGPAIAAGFDRHVVKPAGLQVIRSLLGAAELRLAG